jgi:hypothetical protein
MTITVSLSGGLGNQLFQYAAGYALAQKHQTDLVLDISAYARDKLRGYALGPYQLQESVTGIETPVTDMASAAKSMIPAPLKPFARMVYRHLIQPFMHSGRESVLYQEPYFHFDDIFFSLPSTIKLSGFFQSPLYFHGHDDTIRRRFSNPNSLSAQAVPLGDQIKQSPGAVSLHVRRGDYLSMQHLQYHGVIPLSYYQRAFALISASLGRTPDCFVFTDDVAYVKENLDLPGNMICISEAGTSQYDDLYLMSQCQHHIIANSSFSWWGAWLNPSPDKIVIAPRQWFSDATLRERNVTDLCPKDWILL